MKRLVLTLAFLATFALGGMAQSLDFNFDDGTLQGWTVLDGDGDGHNWQPNTDGIGHNGSDGMVLSYSRDYATGDTLTPCNYLVSPLVKLTEDFSAIEFWASALDEIYVAEHFGVFISYDGIHDWTALQEWTLQGPRNWYNYACDLSSYAGQEVYLAIRHYYSSGMSAICVDDVEILGEIVVAQYNTHYVDAIQICATEGQPQFPLTVNVEHAESGPYYGCLYTQPNPAWFFVKMDEPGDVIININAQSYGSFYDVDFCCWGPFSALPESSGELTQDKVVDCSYDSSVPTVCTIPSEAQTGEYYVLVVTNYANIPGDLTFSLGGGTGSLECPHVHQYEPIVADGKQWNVLFSYPWSPPEPQHKYTDIYKIEGDTLVDGVSYKVMYTTRNENLTGWNLWGFLRETEDGQVLSRQDASSYEQILYDFSLEVGDTIIMNGNGFYPDRMFVVETNEILIGGEPRKQIVLEYPWGDQEVWIEGIGSLYGIIDSGSLFLTGGSTNLLCYYEDGDLIWQNTTPGYDECYMVYPTPPTPPEPHHFAPLGAEWYFHVWSQGPITEPPFYYIRHAVTGEAEVQGHLCSVIDGYRYVYEEDGVVYMYNHSTDAFTVMYDFNAEEGDTWYCDIEEGFTCLVTVESVDSVTWNGHTYRTQYVTGYIPDEGFLIYDGRIIEGIGYEKGLFPHEFVYDGTEYAYMRCYLEDGELLYHEGDYDCDYVPGSQPQQPQFEWYYEIQNEDGSITYQYMYQAGDTIINDEPTHILVKINTLYDKGLRDEVTHEYVYERDGKLYWWNKTLEVFTVLYDYEAEVGDYWEIIVGTRPIDMHVDAVEEIEYEGRTYRMLRVSDPEDLFSGNIVCGIGHLTSFFPERLMDKGDGVRVEGMRCYWSEGELVFKYGDEDCDAIISELHGVEEDGPSTPSTGSGTAGTFAVYPNPTNGILFVETVCTPSLPDQTYRITNLVGQTVLLGNINADNQQINVSSLPQGMYFVTVGDMTRKFVVR